MPLIPPPIQLAKAQPTVQPYISTLPISPNNQTQPSVFLLCSLSLYISTSFTTEFQTQNISFFNPDPTKKPIKIKINGCQVYYNTYIFIQKLQTIDSPALKQNLKICLLNKTDR